MRVVYICTCMNDLNNKFFHYFFYFFSAGVWILPGFVSFLPIFGGFYATSESLEKNEVSKYYYTHTTLFVFEK